MIKGRENVTTINIFKKKKYKCKFYFEKQVLTLENYVRAQWFELSPPNLMIKVLFL